MPQQKSSAKKPSFSSYKHGQQRPKEKAKGVKRNQDNKGPKTPKGY